MIVRRVFKTRTFKRWSRKADIGVELEEICREEKSPAQ